jgi:hypothetical protein
MDATDIMTANQVPCKRKGLELSLLLFLGSLVFWSNAPAAPPDEYFAVPGLMDIRTTFSDGIHSPEELVTMARLRGFRVVFFNDHHRVKISYGIPPFRNLLSYSRERPSVMTHGVQAYLDEIDRLSMLFPDMILIPGSIISPFYYWSGSWSSGDLTIHQYDRKILAFNLTKAKDYERIPALEGSLSTNHTSRRLPGLLFFVIPCVIGFYLFLNEKRLLRWIGVTMVIFSSLAIVDYNPFRASRFTPYSGDQGIVPFQEVIDHIHRQGGLAFWNYPEQRSGVREYESVHLYSPPYPEVLWESKNYAGFAAIYGDRITATDPGKHWDLVLLEYCAGRRDQPAWGISTADFHEDGRLGLILGAFPTTFLVKEFSKAAILDALQQGRMYCSRGAGTTWPQLDFFTVSGSSGLPAHMGETLNTSGLPVIRFRVSYRGDEKVPMTIHLVRGGTLLQTVTGQTPLEFEMLDEGIPAGRMTYYRLVDAQKHLTSNPIFVKSTP